jgi:8-oxo-dGTP diphosphatase
VVKPTPAEEQAWFAGLPGIVIAAGAVITDRQHRVLLVKPNYRDLWSLPGGICEFGEAPHLACQREVDEEVGLQITAGRLLAVDWVQPHGTEIRAIMHFVFDGGQVSDGGQIVVQESELDGFSFADRAELPALLPPRGLDRVSGALAALATGDTCYLPHEVSSPPP